jgi:D-amino peptidase
MLVAGDQSVETEAHEVLGEAVITVAVKESFAQLAAESLHPREAQRRLRAAAARAVRERPAVQPFRIAEPVTVEVELARPVLADLAELIDGAERVDGRTVRFQRPDVPSSYRLLRLITVLCSTPL